MEKTPHIKILVSKKNKIIAIRSKNMKGVRNIENAVSSFNIPKIWIVLIVRSLAYSHIYLCAQIFLIFSRKSQII